MVNRKQIAKELFLQGYSCAQAVAGAFADMAGLTTEEMLKVSIAFGRGFMQRQELCGALSGMGIVLGAMYGQTDKDGKKEFYQRFGDAVSAFAEENGSVNCKQLLEDAQKNLQTADLSAATAEEYQQKPCLKYVFDCVDYVEGKMKSE